MPHFGICTHYPVAKKRHSGEFIHTLLIFWLSVPAYFVSIDLSSCNEDHGRQAATQNMYTFINKRVFLNNI